MQNSSGEARTNSSMDTPTHGLSSVGRLAKTYQHRQTQDLVWKTCREQ